ncbi:hypothetical protein [Parapedobacter pyrenivorans]|uniref:hypothetical protein n=1 Tax=Parapedobacter pyrenivorans TaxID=1305674 RepID=UPI00166D28F7|nr:hypothetical protein [Parapedobacter pyrenivorans]
MRTDFERIKKAWHGRDGLVLADYNRLQTEIAYLRKQKKNRLLLWSSAVIVCSVLMVCYVVYTDELNSIYKSISEYIILFTSIYLFGYSWKSITKQKKEYLLNSLDFMKGIAYREMKRKHVESLTGCICLSLFMIASFFYFLDKFLQSQRSSIISIATLLGALAILWAILKPAYEKRRTRKHETFLRRIDSILKNSNN